ncbi:MAG: hypothetical protein LDL44_13855 [Caenispirillum sp.]|nr:hypothetical protein [Caenispirillum sp.]
MIRGPERQTNPWTASRWLPLGVSAIIIASLAILLIAALRDMEERAEAMMVDMTLRNIRTGLTLAKGEAILAGREHEIPFWAGRNPTDWLAGRPADYEGDCRDAASPAPGGWCFDAGRRELRYRPRHDRLLRPEDQSGAGAGVLRWRARAGADGMNGLSVEKVTDFSWQ